MHSIEYRRKKEVCDACCHIWVQYPSSEPLSAVRQFSWQFLYLLHQIVHFRIGKGAGHHLLAREHREGRRCFRTLVNEWQGQSCQWWKFHAAHACWGYQWRTPQYFGCSLWKTNWGWLVHWWGKPTQLHPFLVKILAACFILDRALFSSEAQGSRFEFR